MNDPALAAAAADTELQHARETCSRAFLACLRGAVDAPLKVQAALTAIDGARGVLRAVSDPDTSSSAPKPAPRPPADFPIDAGMDATLCPACSSASEVKNTGSGVRCRACVECGTRWHTAEVPTERTVKR